MQFPPLELTNRKKEFEMSLTSMAAKAAYKGAKKAAKAQQARNAEHRAVESQRNVSEAPTN